MKIPFIFTSRVKKLERENELLKEDLKAIQIDADELDRRMRALEIKICKPPFSQHC